MVEKSIISNIETLMSTRLQIAGGIISLSHLWKCYGTTRVPGEFMGFLSIRKF